VRLLYPAALTLRLAWTACTYSALDHYQAGFGFGWQLRLRVLCVRRYTAYMKQRTLFVQAGTLRLALWIRRTLSPQGWRALFAEQRSGKCQIHGATAACYQALAALIDEYQRNIACCGCVISADQAVAATCAAVLRAGSWAASLGCVSGSDVTCCLLRLARSYS
jgi:hypothetical protein